MDYLSCFILEEDVQTNELTKGDGVSSEDVQTGLDASLSQVLQAGVKYWAWDQTR